MTFTRTGDYYGWREDDAGNWHYTLFIENGRIKDTPERPMRTGLRKIAEIHKGDFRLTSNQNLMIASVKKRDRKQIDTLLKQHGLHNEGLSGLRRNAMACVALPTCGLALSESERYLPTLIDALDDILDEAGLRQDEIVIRMTGCPNGCARAYLAEIGLVGRGPGTYNLYLGAAFDGTRLNKLYRQDVGHDAILDALRPLLLSYAKEREDGERFGDFVIHQGVVKATRKGPDFHDA
jgi:sulfite reductase (NADPH) hemoprotein beta-component